MATSTASVAATDPPNATRILSPGAATVEFHISTTGSDANPGTTNQPFATLEKARDAIRALKVEKGGVPTGGITVWIRGGKYFRGSSFRLTAEDSGLAGSPITYRGCPGEDAIFTGGRVINGFQMLSDPAILARLQAAARSHVLVADISQFGLSDFGSLSRRGALPDNYVKSDSMRPWMVELFFQNQRMQLARWPNQDHSQEVWAYTVPPVPGTYKEGPTDNWFSYREDRPSAWQLDPPIWVHGMWTHWWCDSYEQVTAIDASTKKFTTDRPGDYGYSATQPYEALNCLEELDQPGEWVLDPARARVYFWPPVEPPGQEAVLSLLPEDFLHFNAAQWITIQNLTFEAGRASGVVMTNSSYIEIAGNTFRNLGNMGVIVGNGSKATGTAHTLATYDYAGGATNRIVGNEFYGLGEGGVAVSGGNKVTLSPAGHVVLNNYIHQYNTNIRCYRPGIRLDGVGCKAAHNVIHSSPHQGLSFTGNDHVIEYNRIYDVCQDTSDAGVLYTCARDWKARGTVIRYNFLQPSREHGMYLDDFTSGTTLYGNIIMFVSMGVLVGGGRDNVFENNLVLGFSSTGWHVNNRGNTWASGSIPGLVQSLRQVQYTNAPYITRYPELAVLHQDILNYEASPNTNTFYQLALPKGNRILRNVFLKAKAYVYDMSTNDIEQVGNWYLWSYDPGFIDANAINTHQFALKPTAQVIAEGFQPIPQERIGVYRDAYGRVDPANITPYPPPTVTRRPFLSGPLAIPGRIQVEDFDEGAQGVASLGSYPWNNAWGSGRYRSQVRFWVWGSLLDGARTYKMDLYSGNWTEYTVAVAETAQYDLSITNSTGKAFHIEFDRVNRTGPLTTTPVVTNIALTAGTHTMRLVCDDGYVRLDYVDVVKSPVQLP